MLQSQENELREAKRACLFMVVRAITIGILLFTIALAIWAGIN